MEEQGTITITKKNKIATIEFYHPKSNSLPSYMLKEMKENFEKFSVDPEINVIILRSRGDKAFCAGASFDELLKIENYEQGKEFFMGFARLINSMRKCKKIIIGRIHNKVVGGGVGLVASTDYALATTKASLRLSELALGLGPFVVGPPIERKIGIEKFETMALDCEWRLAEWAKESGFYHDVYETEEELDKAVTALAESLASRSPDALESLKKIFWENTEHWDELLEERAENSGRLVLSDYTRKFLEDFKNKKKN